MHQIPSAAFSLRRLMLGCVRAAILVATVSSPLAAQLTWTRNVPFGAEAVDFYALVKSPENLSTSYQNDTQWLVTQVAYYEVTHPGATPSHPSQWNEETQKHNFKQSTLMTLTGTTVTILGRQNALITFDLADRVETSINQLRMVSLAPNLNSSMAASQSGAVTIMTSAGFGYAVSPTGDATAAFGSGIGSGPGQFDGAIYHIYSPNGRMYVLDYGNSRVQMFNPDDYFAYVGEFALQAGVTTANMQFAIGPDGTVYLGDGLGGGSAYTADGQYLSSFSLPGDAYEPPPGGGQSYVTADMSGQVYVYDATGFHQYEVNAAPEPSSFALLATGVFLGALVKRRRARNQS